MSPDVVDMITEKVAEKSVLRSIPDDCFAMIRLPVSLSVLARLAEIAAKASPGSVMRQQGDWMLILHAPKREEVEP
jgi:hypothetical protein